jgi:hypothetical protein
MKTEKLIELIDLYFDGELERGQEAILFTSLGADKEAREYFKKLNSLHSAISNSIDEFPQSLDYKILHNLEKIDSETSHTFFSRKVFTSIALSFSIILLAVSIFFYSKSEEYKVQLVDLTREVKQQNENILSIMNTLPEVEVRGAYIRMKMIRVNGESEGFRYIRNTLPEIEVNENYIRMKEVKVTAKI